MYTRIMLVLYQKASKVSNQVKTVW